MNRRVFVASTFGLLAARSLRAIVQDDDLGRIDVVKAKATQAGIENLGATRAEMYLALGDADAGFAADALRLCNAFAREFLKHFQDRKFSVQKPRRPMLMVILADPGEFASFLGENPGSEVRGSYDVEAGWLAICDNRGAGGQRPERANTITLFHEAAHQLCFECGLLDRLSDVPLCISEGLATYCEVRSPDGRTKIGARNADRMPVLRALYDRAGKRRGDLLPLLELIKNDALLNEPTTQQLAYAQSWSLIHMMMQSSEDQERLRAYLEAIRPRRDASKRTEDATAYLGPLDALSDRLEQYVTKLVKNTRR